MLCTPPAAGALADDIPGYRREDLSVFTPEEWASHVQEFDFQTWVDAARSAARQVQLTSQHTQPREACGATSLQIYPVSPDCRSDGKVTGTINGQGVRFSYFRNFPTYYYDTNYCRFAADGPVQVELTVHTEFERAFLRGLLCDVPVVQEGRTLRFTLPGPGHYYLQLPDLLRPVPGNEDSGTYTVAFWIDDLNDLTTNAMNPDAADVTNVVNAGTVSHPEEDQTEPLQALLDEGGRLYFPAGIYRSGTLHIRSNTTVYLAPGAMLKAAAQRATVDKRLLHIEGAENVRLHGPGTIDANYDGYPRDTANIHIIYVDRCRNITFEDICFRNCNSWALHLARSERLVCRNIRVLSGKDGIDPDSSRDVLIEHVFVQSKDDAIVIKTRQPPFTTERVTVRNSIVASDASALKVGTEIRTLMCDITFENCDVFDSDRGIVLYARDGGPIENVTWRNIRLFMIHWPHETGGAPLQFFITRRGGAMPVRNMLVEHVNANMIVSCGFSGLEEAPLNGLTLHDVLLRVESPAGGNSYFRGNRDAHKPDLGSAQVAAWPPLFKIGDHVDVTIDGLTINWQGHRSSCDGLVPDGASGLTIEHLIETD